MSDAVVLGEEIELKFNWAYGYIYSVTITSKGVCVEVSRDLFEMFPALLNKALQRGSSGE